jgi:hypothetical protein
LLKTAPLRNALEEIYRYPLKPSAADVINRQLRSGISDDELAACVLALRDEGELCDIQKEAQAQEPQIICSLGLSSVSHG